MNAFFAAMPPVPTPKPTVVKLLLVPVAPLIAVTQPPNWLVGAPSAVSHPDAGIDPPDALVRMLGLVEVNSSRLEPDGPLMVSGSAAMMAQVSVEPRFGLTQAAR